MEYQTFRKIIKRAAEKAGINKRVFPYILRHSRATVLANHLTEALMCEYFGWVQGSDSPRTYVHLSGRDIDRAISRIYGLEEEEQKDAEVKPKKCPRCGYINASTDIYCGRCGLILDESVRLKMEMEEQEYVKELLKIILENPDLLAKVQERRSTVLSLWKL